MLKTQVCNTHTDPHREILTQTHTDTHRHTDRQTHTHTHTHTHMAGRDLCVSYGGWLIRMYQSRFIVITHVLH